MSAIDSRGNHAAAATRVLGALALELVPGSTAARDRLAQAQAGTLAEGIARDLAGLAPQAAQLDLVLVGAHYDAVELLRPGWPLQRELAQLAARAPGAGAGGGGRVIAFGAHDGQLPGTLAPAEEFAGGPLRVLPFVLVGDQAVAGAVAEAFERELMERGMAGAGTALLVQELFGLRVEHAHYLTVHDLAAMVALQYEHAGLAALWPLIETALLAPGAEQWLDAPPEPLLHYADGEARIAMFSPAAWRERYGEGDNDGERLERRYARFQARERQFAAVLGAHGVPVTFVHCGSEAAPDV